MTDIRITAAIIAAIAPFPKLGATAVAAALDASCAEYGIDTPARLAAFLAQIAHESDGFNTATEYASGAAYDCDNPICCNPSHLRLGTQADNIRDAITRNRHVPPPVGLRGRKNEEKLQISVIKYLRVSLPSEAVFFHCPNGGSRHLIEAMKFKRLGVMPGIPDILIIYRGRLIAIELKGPKGRISPDQSDMHMRLTMAGAVVNVCRSLEDVQGFLATIIPLKGRLAA